jgi:hypothetical protein
MPGWRRIIGTALILAPLIILVLLIPLGVMLGAMGMDVHWTSKRDAYIGWTCIALIVCTCIVVGLRLRRIKS